MPFYPYKYKTEQYGEKAYERAYNDWKTSAGKYNEVISNTLPQIQTAANEARTLTDYYKPGGGYGAGQSQQARETVGKGVAQSSVASVQAGQSSMFGSRGINVLAGAELSKLYKNIEDTRAQLLTQAFTPYAQMIQTLGQLAGQSAQVATSQPTRNSYITQGQPTIVGYGSTM